MQLSSFTPTEDFSFNHGCVPSSRRRACQRGLQQSSLHQSNRLAQKSVGDGTKLGCSLVEVLGVDAVGLSFLGK
uniref:Uncharacterized protein n=1 Tax=Arundo donax TaxID=35708 RepID=A0A0A9BFV9_ARUDO